MVWGDFYFDNPSYFELTMWTTRPRYSGIGVDMTRNSYIAISSTTNLRTSSQKHDSYSLCSVPIHVPVRVHMEYPSLRHKSHDAIQCENITTTLSNLEI